MSKFALFLTQLCRSRILRRFSSAADDPNLMADKRCLSQSGNVLFLILIAVALFAALSYAVTNSLSQSEPKQNEVHAVGASELTQYITNMGVVVMRMGFDGVDKMSLEFNKPEDFGALNSTKDAVFHPQGGGVPYQKASPEVMASGANGTWHFNAEFEINQVGASQSNSLNGNDIIAFLPGIRKEVCEQTNKAAGFGSTIPNITSDVSARYTADMDNAYVQPTDEVILGSTGSNGTDVFDNATFGCFQNNGGAYVFFQLVVAR